MNIVNNNFQELVLTNPLFEEHYENTVKIKITVEYNCCDNITFSDTLEKEDSSASEENIFTGIYSYMNNDLEIILPKEMFGNIGITDGIYTITVQFYYEEDNIIFQTFNCIFIDKTIGCKLVTYMSKNLSSDKATELAMLYYALSQSQDCDCECENICILYQDLYNNLFNSKLNNCGC